MKVPRIGRRFLIAAVAVLAAGQAASPEVSAQQSLPGPRARVFAAEHDFGEVMRGEAVEHEFLIENAGDRALTIADVRILTPATTIRLPSRTIEPGQRLLVALAVDTDRWVGEVVAGVDLTTNDISNPVLGLRLRGIVRPLIEITPGPEFYVSTFVGSGAVVEGTILNNDEAPLELGRPVIDGRGLAAAVTPVRPGREFALTIEVLPDAPPGGSRQWLRIPTNVASREVLSIPVNVLVKQTVHAFPARVEFGTVSMGALGAQPTLAQMLTQSIVIEPRDPEGFEISVEHDLPPFLRVEIREPATEARAYGLDVVVVADLIEPGLVDARIRIRTTDLTTPELVIPVTGTFEQ